VTMGTPYAATLAAGLICSRKTRRNCLFLSRVNV
jgi:hypothetical protein